MDVVGTSVLADILNTPGHALPLHPKKQMFNNYDS